MLKGLGWLGIVAFGLSASGCAIFWGDDGGGPERRDEDDGVTEDDDGEEPEDPDATAPTKVVFVTSNTFPGSLTELTQNPDPLAAADELCQLAADAAELGGTYHAWISTTSEDAIDHVAGDGPWADLAGQVVFPNRASLAVGPVAPLHVDERGDTVTYGDAWTGTNAVGRAAADTCADWADRSFDVEATAGSLGSLGSEWTDNWSLPCNWNAHLLCFEE